MTVNQKGRTERIHVNLEAIYPSPDIVGSELSLDELRAASRGWLTKVWQRETIVKDNEIRSRSQESTKEVDVNVDEVVREVSEKLVIARDPPALDENGAAKEPGREGKGRRMKIKEVNETQISRSSSTLIIPVTNT